MMLCASSLCGRQPLVEDDVSGDLRILITGPTNTGKTNLCKRFLDDPSLDKRSPGNVMGKLETVDGELCGIRLEDITVQLPLAANSDDACRLKQALRNNDGLIVVYSVTDKSTLRLAHQLITYVQHAYSMPTVLVGCKADMTAHRDITKQEAEAVSFDLGVAFYETSTLSANPYQATHGTDTRLVGNSCKSNDSRLVLDDYENGNSNSTTICSNGNPNKPLVDAPAETNNQSDTQLTGKNEMNTNNADKAVTHWANGRKKTVNGTLVLKRLMTGRYTNTSDASATKPLVKEHGAPGNSHATTKRSGNGDDEVNTPAQTVVNGQHGTTRDTQQLVDRSQTTSNVTTSLSDTCQVNTNTLTSVSNTCHVTSIFHDLVRQIRCVRLRKAADRERTFLSQTISNLSLTKNITARLSFRPRKKHVYRRKLST